MAYQKINWANGEAGNTPLNANNLNKMDNALDDFESRIGDAEYQIGTLETTVAGHTTAISEKMDKNNPTGSGTLEIMKVKTSALVAKDGNLYLPNAARYTANDTKTFPKIADKFDSVDASISSHSDSIWNLNIRVTQLNNNKLDKSGEVKISGGLEIESSTGIIGEEPSTSYINGFMLQIPQAEFSEDISVLTDSNDAVVNVGSVINTMKSDIQELKDNVGFEITSASPLNGCSASSIVGIDVDGCSTQTSANKFEQGGIGHTTNANYSANKVDNTTRVRTSDLIATVSGSTYTITCNSAYMVIVQSFNASKLLVDTSGTNAWNNPLTVTASNYMAIAVRKSDNSNISVAEAINANVLVNGSPIFSPTPTNPIPIVDASGDVVAHTVNLVNTATVGKNWNGSTHALTGYYEVAVESGKTYTVSYNSRDNITLLKLFTFTADNEASYTSLYDLYGNLATHYTFTVPSGSTRARVLVGCSGTMTAELMASKQVQLEQGTTATDYVSYASNKITLPTLRSVGTVKDELIVNGDGGSKTVKVGTVDLGTLNWQKSASGDGRFYADVNGGKESCELLCTAYAYDASHNYISNKVCSGSNGSGVLRLFIVDTTYSTASAFKTAMNGKTLYYALATPTTTTLTASEVSAIRALQTYSGTTIIDSALDVKSVTYHAGVKEYIDWRFEQLATLMLGEE